ncbi:MAG: hypothetical protein EAZ92_09085 [Candidatus Kapaibacterium sp.]|nr:MAG: hypothetical protein EAZ92_09085 [Candidatus Kapabacteria bacterium]
MRAQYPYENLDWQEFERLVIELCHDLLGIAAKTFSDGKDGGRDSRFEGTAEKFPSTSNPWSGVFIIQAKHTTKPIASCSDKDFTKEIDSEIETLAQLQPDAPFENYIIFTNRKLTTPQRDILVNKLKKELSISNVDIIGIEQLNGYLDKLPDLVRRFRLDQRTPALRFFPDDIKEVITTFHEYRKTLGKEVQHILPSLTNIDKERKNALNSLGKEYFDYIQSTSLAYFKQIEEFLGDPKNEPLRGFYEDSTADLRAAITLGRSDFGPFEEVIEHVVEAVFSSVKSDLTNQRGLSGVKRTIRTLLHFMYYHCDIGVKDNVTTP